jgi:hypothetical protein
MVLSTTCLLVAFISADVKAKIPLLSGPQIGAENDRRGFRPQFVAGPSTGQRLCPV